MASAGIDISSTLLKLMSHDTQTRVTGCRRLAVGAEIQAPWQVCLLGRVHAGGLWGEVYSWPLRSVACLLARLALSPGRSFGREELVELLWLGVALDRGRARLRPTLSALRSMLEPAGVAPGSVIVADRLTIHINLSALACDAQLFERHVALGQWLAAPSWLIAPLWPKHSPASNAVPRLRR